MNFEGKQQSLLTFRVGPVLCCAPSLPVRSIITPPRLTQIAGSEPSTPGIFKHGSHIVKVIDLRLKFGVDEAQHTQPGNLIISVSEAGDFAFWVDQILDVFDFPKEGWGNLPPAIPRGIFTHTLLLNNKIHLYSEFEKLATISNLGYLEHYIKQLTEKEAPQPIDTKTTETTAVPITDKTEVNKTSTTKPTSTDKTFKSSLTTASINTTSPVASATEGKTTSSIPSSTTTIKKAVNRTRSSQAHPKDKNTVAGPGSSSVNSILNSRPVDRASQVTTSTSSASAVSSRTTSSQTSSPTSILNHTVSSHPSPSSSSSSTLHKQQMQKPMSSSMNKTDETKIVTTQKTAPNTQQAKPGAEYEEDSSYAGVILFFILLLLLPGAGIYYYFSQQTSEPYRFITEPDTTKNEVMENNVNETATVQTEETKTETLVKLKKESVPIAEAIDIDIDKKEHETVSEDSSRPFTQTEPLSESLGTSEYSAEITQDNNEITITIHQPATKETPEQTGTIISPLPIEEVVKDETIAVMETAPVKTLEEDELPKPIAPEKVINEIVHVVVKGDTLWAIAKKYVKNPFLYPELARLSNIKNPHRIYPGNRVRIRFTNN